MKMKWRAQDLNCRTTETTHEATHRWQTNQEQGDLRFITPSRNPINQNHQASCHQEKISCGSKNKSGCSLYPNHIPETARVSLEPDRPNTKILQWWVSVSRAREGGREGGYFQTRGKRRERDKKRGSGKRKQSGADSDAGGGGSRLHPQICQGQPRSAKVGAVCRRTAQRFTTVQRSWLTDSVTDLFLHWTPLWPLLWNNDLDSSLWVKIHFSLKVTERITRVQNFVV